MAIRGEERCGKFVPVSSDTLINHVRSVYQLSSLAHEEAFRSTPFAEARSD